MSLAELRISTAAVIPGIFAAAIPVSTLLALPGCQSVPTPSAALIDPLMAPIQQAPPPGRVFAYRSASEPPLIVFEWRHGMPTKQIPSPHNAEKFIVCVYDELLGECESGTRDGVPTPIWFEARADDPAIDRTPITLEKNPVAPVPDLNLGYAFRTSLQVRPEYRGRTLLWQVAACADGTCRMTNPRSLRLGQPADAIGL